MSALESKPLSFISLEYNILKVAGEDTWTFFYIAVCLTLGVGFLFQALTFISFSYLTNVLLITFGGLTPAVLAMRVKYWMVYKCGRSQ